MKQKNKRGSDKRNRGVLQKQIIRPDNVMDTDFRLYELIKQTEKIYQRDYQKFLNYIRRKVGDQESAEDILQDVFTNVFASLQRKKTADIKKINSWIFTAIRNKIIDYYRKKKTEIFSNLSVPYFGEEVGENFEDSLLDFEFHPEVLISKRLIMNIINQILEQLPVEQKQVFIRNELDGVSFRQISEETGVNINTLLARKRYAVLKLRNGILKECKECNVQDLIATFA